MQISKITPTFNNTQTKTKTKTKTVKDRVVLNNNISFSCASIKQESKIFEPVKRFFKPLTDLYHNSIDKLSVSLANPIGKIIQSEGFKNIMSKTKKANMIEHITTLSSIVLSSFYVKQTLQNEQLEESKRTTLAINQAIVAIVSIISSYTLNKVLAKQINKFVDRYTAVNITMPKIGKYIDGIKCAQSIIIFGTVYRFIAPVIVTPIANHIGNKLKDKNTNKNS